MKDIYLLIEGKQEGPYTEDQVRQSLAEGLIPVDLPAWQEGLQEWTTVAQVLTAFSDPELRVTPKPPPLTHPPQVQLPPTRQFTNDELRRVVKSQRLVIIVFLVGIAAFILNNYIVLLGSIALIIVTILYVYAIYRLATSIRIRFAWLYCIASFIPYVNIIIFVAILTMATRVLKGAGVRVGLMGGKLNDIKD